MAVVASAGGVEALTEFVSLLPADLPVAVLVVLHIPAASPSVLPRILSRAGKLPARHPEDGDPLVAGVVTVAPPDRHLAVADGHIRLLAGARENGHRPSADVLLRSVARNFGPRGAGVVLSGSMDDGAAGLRAVGVAGGFTLVQDPEQAAFPGMPMAAIEEANPQLIGTVAVLTQHLCEWGARVISLPTPVDPPAPALPPRQSSQFTCPECGGTLFEHDEFGVERLRCRVGHIFSLDGLALGKAKALEKALWAAVVALDEQTDVARRIMARPSPGGRTAQLERYRENIAVNQERAAVLLGLIHELAERPGTSEEYQGIRASDGGRAPER